MERESDGIRCCDRRRWPIRLASATAPSIGRRKKQDISVCVIEKGSEVGAHILSGAVMERAALNELFQRLPARCPPAHAS